MKYVVENGLHKVEPYCHKSVINCKGRWLGRTVLDILLQEFKGQTVQDHRRNIERRKVAVIRGIGRARSHGRQTTAGDEVLNVVIKSGDVLVYDSHWHEPPIRDLGGPIHIVQEVGPLVAVAKPSGLPVHPAGLYRYNTLTSMLKDQLGVDVYGEYIQSVEEYTGLIMIWFFCIASHRLDRLTSGLMIVARSKAAASKFSVLLQDRQVRKEYIAKVQGKFPDK
jgi:23S rRNA-/tRNA-specific pseudouridylate synthase